jgi:hypothetical protein
MQDTFTYTKIDYKEKTYSTPLGKNEPQLIHATSKKGGNYDDDPGIENL